MAIIGNIPYFQTDPNYQLDVWFNWRIVNAVRHRRLLLKAPFLGVIPRVRPTQFPLHHMIHNAVCLWLWIWKHGGMLYGLSSNGLNNRNTPSKVALLWLKLPNWPILQHFPTVAICEGKRGRTVKSRRGLGKLGGVDEDLFSRKDPSRSDKNFPSAIQQDLYMGLSGNRVYSQL